MKWNHADSCRKIERNMSDLKLFYSLLHCETNSILAVSLKSFWTLKIEWFLGADYIICTSYLINKRSEMLLASFSNWNIWLLLVNIIDECKNPWSTQFLTIDIWCNNSYRILLVSHVQVLLPRQSTTNRFINFDTSFWCHFISNNNISHLQSIGTWFIMLKISNWFV